MARKKHSPEQIVALLRQIEVAIANGKLTPQACRALTVRAAIDSFSTRLLNRPESILAEQLLESSGRRPTRERSTWFAAKRVAFAW